MSKSTAKSWAYVGTLTSLGNSCGIYVFELDHGSLGALVQVVNCANPTFLAVSQRRQTLYAASHNSRVDGISGGAITSFSIDVATGHLREINRRHGVSAHPAYINIDKSDRWVLTASTMGGSVSIYPMSDEGVGECRQVVQHHGERMAPWPELLTSVIPTAGAPMAHCVIPNPANDRLAVTDLGLDRLIIYPFDSSSGTIDSVNSTIVQETVGSGPRHCVWHPSGEIVYCLNEKNSTVSVLQVQAGNKQFRRVQQVSCIPADYTGPNKTAEIRLHPSGRKLYVSNRGHDSVASFDIDPSTAEMIPSGFVTCDIKEPRGMSLLPDSTGLLVANQAANTVVSFQIDRESGRLEKVGRAVSVPSPTCVAFFTPTF